VLVPSRESYAGSHLQFRADPRRRLVISARTAIGAHFINVMFETVATKPTLWEAFRASVTINGSGEVCSKILIQMRIGSNT